jgi:multisubunit Na+/H+ antiporter MnhB subunit
MKAVGGSGTLQAGASTASGDGTSINLAKEADKEFSGFNPAIGKERQRWYMLVVIGCLFVVLNAAVIWLISRAIAIDVTFVTAHPELADKRIITSAVFESLIGATVVQTGAVTWAMARFLFPNERG